MSVLFRNSSTLCAWLFGIVGIVFAVQIDYANLSGEIVPIACSAMCLIAAAAELFGGKSGDIDWSVTGVLGLTLYTGYLALIWVVGFLAATVVFVAAVFFFARRASVRAAAVGAFFGVVLTAAIYGIFVEGMGNLLPMGMFE